MEKRLMVCCCEYTLSTISLMISPNNKADVDESVQEYSYHEAFTDSIKNSGFHGNLWEKNKNSLQKPKGLKLK